MKKKIKIKKRDSEEEKKFSYCDFTFNLFYSHSPPTFLPVFLLTISFIETEEAKKIVSLLFRRHSA